MYDSKLLLLLQTLKHQSREILEFEKFVKSPYFNPKKEVVNLLLYIKKYWNGSEKFQQQKLTKDLAFKKLFPKESKYIGWKINECVSDLTLLLEEFITIQELKKNKAKKAILLTTGLKNRGIDKYFFKKVDSLEKQLNQQLEKNTAQNPDFFLNQMQLKESLYYHPNHDKNTPENNDILLKSIDQKLDHYYIIKKLQFASEVYSRHKIYGMDYTPFLLEEVTHSIKKRNFDPVIDAYLKIVYLFKTQDVTAIPAIKEQIFSLVSNNELDCNIDILMKLINTIPPIPNRRQLYFEVYKLAAERNLLLENGYIPVSNYLNIIQLGCALKELSWINDFKKNYTKYLKINEDSLENVNQLFEGYINFYQENYRETFILLDKIKLEDMSYGIRRYTLLFRTIIEGRKTIGFKYDFDNYCANFRAYIQRKYRNKEMSLNSKNGCLCYLYLVNKMYYWDYNKINKAILYRKLNNSKEISFRRWLKGKIDALK